MTSAPESCEDCLRRAWLIGDLSGHIEVAAEGGLGKQARELLALPDEDLAAAMARGQAGEILARAGDRDAGELRDRVEAARAWACCCHDPLYPAALAEDRQAPATLFGRGDPALMGRLAGLDDALTVVGSRRPSIYGRQLAETLARELAAAGLVVVSGMALGIDSRAHSGTLTAGGVTVAVLGSGPDVPYPVRLRRLYETIVERGLVLSELPPGTQARRWTFPARNRIMAALSQITIVVEAAEHSGSLITSGMATDLGRDVGAVPGHVGSTLADGTNKLLYDGARLVRDAGDVLDLLAEATGRPRRHAPARPPAPPDLAPELLTLLAAVEEGRGALGELASGPEEARAVLAGLGELEFRGLIRRTFGGRYEPIAP